MKTITLQQQKSAIMRFKQARVCDLLQWQQQAYSQFIYERGHEFLDAVFGNDTGAIYKLSRRTEFWEWWKVEWNTRDAVYLDDVDGREDELYITTRIRLYKALHSAEQLACELSIPRLVYPNDFTTINIELS